MSGNGTFRLPWDFPTAIGSFSIPAGQTLELRGGVYAQAEDFSFVLDGTAEAPILVRPHNHERVIIDNGILINGAYVHFYDLEFTFTGWVSRVTLDEGSNPVDIPMKRMQATGAGCKFYNCKFYDMTEQDAWITATGAEFYDCIFSNCGWAHIPIDLEATPHRGHGHNMYTQNQTTKKVFNNCIFFQAFSTGLKIYTEGSVVDEYEVDGCILFNNGILYPYQGSLHHDWNFNIHGVTTHLVLNRNLSYHSRANNGDGANCIGWSNSPLDGMSMTNNYLAGNTALRTDAVPINSVISGNIIIGSSNNINTNNFPDNAYLSWPGVDNYIFINQSVINSQKIHLGVMNWELLDEVEIDLSSVSGIEPGDTLSAWNVQASLGEDIQTRVLDANKRIILDMRAVNRTVATPVQWPAPATTFPVFGCFVLEKL